MRADDWFILRVMPSLENDATKFFEQEFPQVETYYPVAKSNRIVRHEQIPVERAAFQGYIYARCAQLPDLHRIGEYCRAKPRYIVREDPQSDADGYPVMRPLYERDHIVAGLRKREANGGFAQSETNPTIEKLIGTQVRIPSGLFMGHYAKVHSIEGSIVKLRLWMLGKRAFLSFCFDDLFTKENCVL